MLSARCLSSLAISQSWAQTLASPQFPKRSKIRAKSVSRVPITLSGIKIIFSRPDIAGIDVLWRQLKCSGTVVGRIYLATETVGTVLVGRIETKKSHSLVTMYWAAQPRNASADFRSLFVSNVERASSFG